MSFRKHPLPSRGDARCNFKDGINKDLVEELAGLLEAETEGAAPRPQAGGSAGVRKEYGASPRLRPLIDFVKGYGVTDEELLSLGRQAEREAADAAREAASAGAGRRWALARGAPCPSAKRARGGRGGAGGRGGRGGPRDGAGRGRSRP